MNVMDKILALDVVKCGEEFTPGDVSRHLGIALSYAKSQTEELARDGNLVYCGSGRYMAKSVSKEHLHQAPPSREFDPGNFMSREWV